MQDSVSFVGSSFALLGLLAFYLFFLDSSLGKGSVVGVDLSGLLFGSFEAGLAGYGFEDSLGSNGGVFAGLRSQGDFGVAQFWMLVDFGDGHESFSR